MNAPITFEMNCETRLERELLVSVEYTLETGEPVVLSANPCHADIPLTGYEWEQIEAETYVHAAQVAAETVEDDRRDVMARAA